MLDDFMLSSSFAPTTNRPMILHSMLQVHFAHISKEVWPGCLDIHRVSVVVASRPGAL